MVFRRTAHAAYDTAYHLVWLPKYRKHILEGALAQRVEQMCKEIAEADDITIDEMEVTADYVHIFCSFPPRYSIAQVVTCISRDWVVRFDNCFYQLKPRSRYGPAAGKVQVRRYLNGELHFSYRGQEVAFSELAARPAKEKKQSAMSEAKKKYIPSANHPWRKSWRGSES